MKVTVDTNILVRAAALDDMHQAELSTKLLGEAELLAVTLPALCEFCWVMKSAYGFTPAQLAQSIRFLIEAENVVMDREAAEAGIALLNEGGDFADGVIAFDGRWLGGETFVSFDKKAVSLLQARGEAARIPE